MKHSFPFPWSLSAAAALFGAVLALTAVTGCAVTTEHAKPSGAAPYTAGQAKETPAGQEVGTGTGTAPAGCPTAASQPLPEEFPATLPVPDGAIVTSVEHRSHRRLIVATVVRDGFDSTLAFLQKQLPKAGYALRDGEVEEDDAESDFSSPGVDGRWTLRKMPDCAGGVYLTYLTSTAD